MQNTKRATPDVLVEWVDIQTRLHPRIPLLFVSGAQGIGKSTALKRVGEHFDHRIAVLGLDDFYHTKETRAALAQEFHPLLEVRGPPGTHDLALLNSVIDRLLQAKSDDTVSIPVFDKKIDDRLPKQDWHAFTGPPLAILLEGLAPNPS